MTTIQHILMTLCSVALYAGVEAGCDRRELRPRVALVPRPKPSWTVTPLRAVVQDAGPLRTVGFVTVVYTSRWVDSTTMLARRMGDDAHDAR